MQIIRAKPDKQTMRQAALSDGLEQAISGLAGYEDDVAERDRTLRQQALEVAKTRMDLQSKGYDTSHLSNDQIAQGLGMEKPRELGLRGLFGGDGGSNNGGNQMVASSEGNTLMGSLKGMFGSENSGQSNGQVDLYGKRTPEWIAKNQRDESDKELDRQYKKAQIAKMNSEGGQGMGKQLSATEVAKFDEGNQIPMMLSDIKATLANNKDSFGPIAGRIAGLNPWDEKGQAIESQVSAAAQAFGRLMEGGVLKEQDVARYRKMFPNQSDTPETAANKLANVERLLSQRQNSTIGALKGSGYNVSAIDKGLSVPSAPDILNGGASSGSWGNQATANDEASMRNKLKTISREDKIRMLQGGR